MQAQRNLLVVSLMALGLALMAAPALAQDQAAVGAPPSRSSGLRIAVQGRLDALNIAGLENGYNLNVGGGPDLVIPITFVPQVTLGVRLLDTRLFLGLGFGFFGASESQCGGSAGGCADEETTASTSGFELSPLASFDLLQDPARIAALYLVGWLNLASLGGYTVERVTPGRTDTTTVDADFYWGLNIGVGVRGNITPAVAIGTEWGWGFLSTSNDGGTPGPADDQSNFIHGVFGTIFLEASVGL